jgi:hypothetical protein
MMYRWAWNLFGILCGLGMSVQVYVFYKARHPDAMTLAFILITLMAICFDKAKRPTSDG